MIQLFRHYGVRQPQLKAETIIVPMALRFLWNATRGHRFTPWRSEYLKWRIETYSGRKAETVNFSYFWSFVWKQRVQLLRFLGWTRDYGTRSRQPQ